MNKWFISILLILCVLIGRAGAAEKYVYTDIVSIKWGSKAGETGENADHILGLPYILKANAKNKQIYLYDNINAKIESFDYDGNHLHSFPTDIESGNTIYFDKGNNVILIKSDFVGPKIEMRRYSPEGVLLNKFDLIPENLNMVEYGYFFVVDQTQLVFPNLDNNRKYWALNIGTGEIKHDVEPVCVILKDGRNCILKKTRKLADKENNINKYYIEIKDEKGEIINEFQIDDDLDGYSILGADKNGFIYLLFELNEIQVDPDSYETLGYEVRLCIAKYSGKGELILKQKLMEGYEAYGLENKRHSFVDLDIDGNIFQIFGKKDGVHLLKWEQKTVEP